MPTARRLRRVRLWIAANNMRDNEEAEKQREEHERTRRELESQRRQAGMQRHG